MHMAQYRDLPGGLRVQRTLPGSVGWDMAHHLKAKQGDG